MHPYMTMQLKMKHVQIAVQRNAVKAGRHAQFAPEGRVGGKIEAAFEHAFVIDASKRRAAWQPYELGVLRTVGEKHCLLARILRSESRLKLKEAFFMAGILRLQGFSFLEISALGEQVWDGLPTHFVAVDHDRVRHAAETLFGIAIEIGRRRPDGIGQQSDDYVRS